mmetsp:Transcript_53202/g.130368  ORF Transcript_53202/g.130368 Transcript_53202/m.130368 type:complete len:222 (+) Transcript_53202:2-667(+)
MASGAFFRASFRDWGWEFGKRSLWCRARKCCGAIWSDKKLPHPQCKFFGFCFCAMIAISSWHFANSESECSAMLQLRTPAQKTSTTKNSDAEETRLTRVRRHGRAQLCRILFNALVRDIALRKQYLARIQNIFRIESTFERSHECHSFRSKLGFEKLHFALPHPVFARACPVGCDSAMDHSPVQLAGLSQLRSIGRVDQHEKVEVSVTCMRNEWGDNSCCF